PELPRKRSRHGKHPSRDELLAPDQESPKPAAVPSLGHVVPGDWTKMVIVCAGATKDELDKALGFEWKDAPSLQASSNFISMAVFARKNDVESFDNVGSDPFIEGEWYFTPCTSEILGDPDTAEPLSLPRAHSKIFLTFHNSDTPHFWYVSKQEFQRLRSESNNFRESDVSQ
ncbi:hypothetical protein, partial [Parafrigoribacterium humi]|uniref:hypothetical protein n=1 Tax=Parafrigoribacterium humi TaxID=3144664 RepID=UPI0032ED97D4